MAWRPYENLISGVLDNTTPGKVDGAIYFCRKDKPALKVTLDLVGDFHEDIRGKTIRITNPQPGDKNQSLERPGSYMEGFSLEQIGEVGDITAGLKVNGDYPYTDYPYIEWFSDANGRVVLELDPSQIEIAQGQAAPQPLPEEEKKKAKMIREQAMMNFLGRMAEDAERKSGIRPITGVIHAKPKK